MPQMSPKGLTIPAVEPSLGSGGRFAPGLQSTVRRMGNAQERRVRRCQPTAKPPIHAAFSSSRREVAPPEQEESATSYAGRLLQPPCSPPKVSCEIRQKSLAGTRKEGSLLPGTLGGSSENPAEDSSIGREPFVLSRGRLYQPLGACHPDLLPSGLQRPQVQSPSCWQAQSPIWEQSGRKETS